jgi:hypothetical protein
MNHPNRLWALPRRWPPNVIKRETLRCPNRKSRARAACLYYDV